MKLFGEYLIDKKLISADALAKALVQQIKSLPSIVEIVYDNQWMKPMDMIQILKSQHHNHTSFLETAKSLGLWKQDWFQLIEKRLATERIPLGEVLVSMGALKADQLTKALDDFFGEGIHLKQEPEAPRSSATSIAEDSKGFSTPAPTAQNFSIYVELLTEGFGPHWLELFQLEPSGHMSRDNLKKAWSEIHKIKSAARLASVEHSAKMLTRLEEVLEEILKRKIDKFPQEFKGKLPIALKTCWEHLWALRQSIAKNNEEASLLADKTFAKNFSESLDGLEVLKFDISFVDMES